jgi:hypothetical protein
VKPHLRAWCCWAAANWEALILAAAGAALAGLIVFCPSYGLANLLHMHTPPGAAVSGPLGGFAGHVWWLRRQAR